VSTTDELAITTGPTGSFGSRSGASLEVCSPSAHVSRVALSEAAGHRTIPLRRCVARPRSDARAAVSRRRSPLRFFALGEVESASLDRADVRGGSCGSYSRRRVDAAAKRIVQTRVPSSSVRRASGIGETGSHAHDGSSLSSAAATISLPGAGHAPTRPLARCSATRRRGTRGLARRESIFPLTGRFSFPREFSPGGAPGVLPSAGLVPQSGGQVARVRPLNE